jgi:integrase
MASVQRRPNGKSRVHWRDSSGRQRNKTFDTERQARDFLAEMTVAKNRGTYVDPHAGRLRFGTYAARWFAAQATERTTEARDRSIMTNHVLPRWERYPLNGVEHIDVQAWVTDLSKHLSPATVAECYRLTNNVFKSACRDRLIGFNPCEDARLPKRRKKDSDGHVISPEDMVTRLLPTVPDRYRCLVALAGMTGLRWGEVVGLRWDAVDLEAQEIQVVRVLVEVSGHVSSKPFPKSKAGRRTVPIPTDLVEMLRRHRAAYGTDDVGHVFTNEVGGSLWRGHFRSRVWRPALVRCGMLGEIRQLAPGRWLAIWTDRSGAEQTLVVASKAQAVAMIVRKAQGGLRFHDLRHSYATWLISSGVPVNDVSAVLGHEQISTTLDRYTHATSDRFDRIRRVVDPESNDEEDRGETERPEQGTDAA